MRNRYRLACGAFSCAGKGRRRSGCGERAVLRPSFLRSRHPRGPLSNHPCRMDQIVKPREPAGDWRDMQAPPDANGFDRLDAAKPKLFHATKITPIYLRKVQNVLSFLPFSQPSGRKLSTPSVPSATPPTARSWLWWKTSEARRQGVSHGYATSKAPFARPSIKGVHHAGMHA